jgi:hypothetical protein
MSVLDKIRDLEKQRAELVKQAKAELLAAAEKAVAELNELGKELGFSYELKEGKAKTASTSPVRAATKETKEDREGRLLALLAEHPDGLFANEICKQLSADKQRVDNDLQALRKAGKVAQADAPDDRKQTGTRGKQPKLWVAA